MKNNPIITRHLGVKAYQPMWQAMRDFTEQRTVKTPDELWLLEHDAVFTQGLNGKSEHILDPSIAIVQSDRGGQITYHGPGQLMVYVLMDIRRAKINVRELVTRLEMSVINMLKEQGVESLGKCDARGVYVNDKKICSIGLRVKKGCSYHGIALNVAMDLSPFSKINPCGYHSLKMTQTSDLCGLSSIPLAKAALLPHLMLQLSSRPLINRELCHPQLSD